MNKELRENILDVIDEIFEEEDEIAAQTASKGIEEVEKLPIYNQAYQNPEDDKLWEELVNQAANVIGGQTVSVRNTKYFSARVGCMLGYYYTILRNELRKTE